MQALHASVPAADRQNDAIPGACTSCDSKYTDRHGKDNPASYTADKQLFIDSFYDVVATSGVSSWPQARAVWRALGERFRKRVYGPEDYITSCTSCDCKRTNWCTELVIRMYIRSGLTVRGDDANNPISSSRALFECVKDKKPPPVFGPRQHGARQHVAPALQHPVVSWS